MLGGLQGFNMSMQYGNPVCINPPPKKCNTQKCQQKYYKKCKKQWMPVGNTTLGAIR